MTNVLLVVLAAGRSKRFVSGATKLVHNVFGRPMIVNSLLLARELQMPVVFVLGHERELVKKTILEWAKDGDCIDFVFQDQQLGTAHALQTSSQFWPQYEHVVVINGDTPFIKWQTLFEFLSDYFASSCRLGFAVSVLPNPAGYGRVVPVKNSYKVVEQKDANEKELAINVVNAGVYIFSSLFLVENIGSVGNQNNAGEFYLPDLINLACKKDMPVFCSKIDPMEAFGINTVQELEALEKGL